VLRIGFRKVAVALVVMVMVTAVMAWNQCRKSSVDLQHESKRLGLTLHPGSVSHFIGQSVFHGLRFESAHGIVGDFGLVRLVHPIFGARRLVFKNGSVALKGPLSTLFDEWQALARASTLPMSFTQTNVVFEDRFLSRVHLKAVSVVPIESGYAVEAEELRLGDARWEHVSFSITKPKTAVVIRWGSTEPAAKPYEARFIPTPGVASEWVVDVPSQPLGGLGIPGFKTLPCERVTGVLSIVVPENPQLKMRGRLQSVADGCKGIDGEDSNPLFGGTVAVAFSVAPQDDHRSWDLRSVEFTSAMFELKGRGALVFDAEPKLSLQVEGSRSCNQLQTHLAPSKYLDQVKRYLALGNANRAQAQAKERELVTLTLSAKVHGLDAMQREVKWHIDGNCGISSADESLP